MVINIFLVTDVFEKKISLLKQLQFVGDLMNVNFIKHI